MNDRTIVWMFRSPSYFCSFHDGFHAIWRRRGAVSSGRPIGQVGRAFFSQSLVHAAAVSHRARQRKGVSLWAGAWKRKAFSDTGHPTVDPACWSSPTRFKLVGSGAARWSAGACSAADATAGVVSAVCTEPAGALGGSLHKGKDRCFPSHTAECGPPGTRHSYQYHEVTCTP